MLDAHFELENGEPLGVVIDRMAPVLVEGVQRASETRRLVPEQIDALFDAGLFWIQVPTALGGSEATVSDTFEAYERLARIDGSVSWVVMATAVTTALMAVHLADDAVSEVFSDPRALSAGQVAPRGTITRVADGYRLKGDFVFASGSAHATWLMGGFREVDGDGQFVSTADGTPSLLLAVVPKERCEMGTDWDPIGLQASGSVTFRIPEQTVAEGFVWPLIDPEIRRGGNVYRMGAFGLTCIAHSAFSVGVARHALDELLVIAREKRARGRRGVLAEDPIFLSEYAQADAALRGARAGALAALADFEAAAAEGTTALHHRAVARTATTHAAKTAVDVCGVVQGFAGSAGLRNGTDVQRCFRDITASEAHVFTDHNSWVDAGSALVLGKSSPFM